ncbi:MAG: hypothetical protein GWN62_10900, partial [Aliifodinibius sp.]|nr:hypothetical protein [Fodinibius sp.]
MNKKKLLITLGTISVLCLVLGVTLTKVQGANYFSDWDASDVEEDAIVGLLDLYVNVSVIPMSKSDSGFRVIHGGIFIAPRDVLTSIYGYDILTNHDYDFLASNDFVSLNRFDEGDYTIKAYSDYTETGYTGWSDRSTDSVYRFTEKSMIEGDTNTAVLFNASEYFDDTSVPADTNNLIVDDESEFVGVHYVAEDGKSVYDYANDVADSFGGTYVETKNGTMIFFGFEDLENIMNLNVEFDEEIGGTSPLGTRATYITKRRCFRFFQRARESLQE